MGRRRNKLSDILRARKRRGLVAGISLFAAAFMSPAYAAEPERFALLVGETDYVQPAGYDMTILKGPANDVAAMKQLLVGRYRFRDDPGHIRVLTGAAASRKGIEDAFRAQLIENARTHPGAIVVFYFSGHGSTTADVNGDEGDGVDETLVAYDSRSANGLDLVDDDLDRWLTQLRQLTPNITVILDSCHSGTATRDGAVSRGLPPNPNMPQPAARREAELDPTPHLLRRKTYTAIAGAMATESSYENSIAAAGGKVHGYLTWFLTQTLDRRPYLTWRQAMNEIQRGVAGATLAQHPQIEGSLDRNAFGLTGQQSTPYVRLASQDARGNIIVSAGVAQGIKEGGTLAIYAPSARILTGDTGRIATARVTFSGLSASRAAVIERTVPTLPADAKVTIVTPFYGTEPLKARLDTLPGQTASAADLAVLTAVRTRISASNALANASATDDWSVAIQKGCPDVDGVPHVIAGAACSAPVYYLASRLSRDPALTRYVRSDAADAADQLAQALNQFARLNALRALTNDNSPLNLSLELLHQDVTETPAGELIPGPIRAVQSSTTPVIAHVDDWFTFKVTNHSRTDVYVALLILNSDGSIGVLSDAPNGDLVKAGRSMIFTTPIHAAPPLGLDTYKIIATTKPDIDFSVLETPDQPRTVASPLQAVLASAASTQARPGEAMKDVMFSEWGTVQLDVKLLPKRTGDNP